MRNKYFNRKTMYVSLCMLMMAVFTLTIGYAALSVTLNISGNAQVNATDWNIYLTNPVVSSGSVSNSVPSITSSVTASFSTTLNIPGDFYEFTIDVVNDGDINALIDGVSKNPTLSPEQAKYINYDVTYSDGSNILSEQTLKVGETKTIKVRVEFRRDIETSDLPTSSETLNLSFTVNYVQSNDSSGGSSGNGSGGSSGETPTPEYRKVTIVSGNGTTVGDEIQMGDQNFRVIGSGDGKVKLLAEYNLLVGQVYDSMSSFGYPLDEEYTKQSSEALGANMSNTEFKGVTPFSEVIYWDGPYPKDVYDKTDPYMYNLLQGYWDYLGLYWGFHIEDITLPTYTDLMNLGCNSESCSSAPDWVYTTSYWTQTAANSNSIYRLWSYGELGYMEYSTYNQLGIRPVVVISTELL